MNDDVAPIGFVVEADPSQLKGLGMKTDQDDGQGNGSIHIDFNPI